MGERYISSENRNGFSFKRAALAMLAGAFVGATLVSIGFGIETLISSYLNNEQHSNLLGTLGYLLLVFMLPAFVASFIAFLLGLLALGIPTWIVLHRLGLRTQKTATISGISVTSLASILIISGLDYREFFVRIDRASNEEIIFWIFNLIMLSLIGGIVAFVIWKLNYKIKNHN